MDRLQGALRAGTLGAGNCADTNSRDGKEASKAAGEDFIF